MEKSVGSIKNEISEKMGLPLNVFSDEPVIEIWAGKKARIENHKGIALYSDECITVRTSRGAVSIKGEKLKIVSLIKEELILEGNIFSAEIK